MISGSGQRGTALVALVCAVFIAGCTADGIDRPSTATHSPSQALTPPSEAVRSDVPTPEATVELPTAPAAPDPVFTPIDLAPAVGPPRDRVFGAAMLSAAEGRPAVVAGIRSADPATSELHTWTSSDGVTWADAAIPVDGDVSSVAVSGDGSVAALSGEAAVNGHRRPFLLTSTDRVTWTSVGLPTPAPDSGGVSVTASGGTVWALVNRFEGEDELLRIDGATVERVSIPVTSVDRVRTPRLVATQGSTVIVVADEGTDQTVAAHRSPDGGRTWDAPVVFAPPRSQVTGMVWAGTGFVVTGSSPSPSGDRRPAAWSSPDGSTWTSEAVAPPVGWSFLAEKSDATLTAPAYAFGRVAAAAVSDAAVRSFVYERRDGSWSPVTVSRPGSSPGSATAIGLLGPVSSDTTGPIALAVDDAGLSVSLQLVTPGGAGAETELAPGAPVAAISPAGDDAGLRLTATTRTVTVADDDTWQRASTDAAFTWSPTLPTLAPAGTDELSDATRHVGPSGAEVALTTEWDDTGIHRLTGRWRPNRDAPWEDATGLDPGISVWSTGLGTSGDTWYAYGTVGPQASEVTAWRSTDGQTWQRAGDVDPVHPHAMLVDDCVLGNGVIVLVGFWTDDLGTRHPLTWASTSDGWVATTMEDLPGDEFNGCTTQAGNVLLATQSDGGTRMVATADGSTFDELVPDAAAADLLTGSPSTASTRSRWWAGVTRVSGGYYAFGYAHHEDYSGFALWLSRDAVTWRWVPVPSGLNFGSFDEVPLEDGSAVLTVETAAGPQAWHVTGIAEVFR